jgi:pimeloyl-ACP methyl ester carboxylesterase
MENIRKYGKAPFNIAVIHGGPGAPGEMAAVAKELSKTCGVLEPLQTKSSLKEQLQELEIGLKENGNLPMTLIGFSWGAWLSFVFAARNSSFVKKLILVSSGPFEERYSLDIMKTRLSRLIEEERMTIDSLSKILNDPNRQDKNEIFDQLGELISKADSYDPLPYKSDGIEYQYDIFKNVWNEAEELRRSGKLVAFGRQIQCPVVAIHGDYDPHLAEGVKIPLSSVIKNFRFILLKDCGHCPWIERAAKDAFYTILKKEL